MCIKTLQPIYDGKVAISQKKSKKLWFQVTVNLHVTLCVTDDPCVTGQHTCDPTYALCVKTATSYYCKCRPSFTGNGTIGHCIPLRGRKMENITLFLCSFQYMDPNSTYPYSILVKNQVLAH